MKFSLATLMAIGMGTASAWAATPCPAVGSDTNGCEFIITVTAVNGGGIATAFTTAVNAPDQGPYDASDDTLVGIVNSSGAVLKGIVLSNTAGQFGFEDDGACIGTFSPGPTAAQCLGGVFQSAGGANGPDYLSLTATSFSNITATSGQVNFNNIANGGSSWFSLEGALNAAQIAPGTPPVTPAPNSIILLMIGLAALTLFYFRGRFARVS